MSLTNNIINERTVLSDLPDNTPLLLELLETDSINLPSVNFVQSKIEEFLKLFNGSYRLPLLNCSLSQKEVLIYLLISLKKNIKYALEDLGKSLTKRDYKFKCGICDEQINIESGKNIWSSLQDHDHFEELYYKFLNNQLDITKVEDNLHQTLTLESEYNIMIEDAANTSDLIIDSAFNQQEMKPSTSGTQKINACLSNRNKMDPDEDVNSFRFNFNVSYDEAVESKIYPSSIMLGLRRYDKVKDFTIQRAGNLKAVCLICNCEINGMRITKPMLVDHAMGQRHLKAAATPEIVEILQFYHSFWLKQEPPIQAHQVYFRPDCIPNFRCALCYMTVKIDQVILHILSDKHRNLVMAMFEKRNNLYFLVNLQVQVYGITQEQFDAVEEEIKKTGKGKEEVKFREKKQKKISNSDASDDAKRVDSQPQAVNHNIIRSIKNPESPDALDRFPNRMKEDVKFLKRITKSDGPAIYCDLCKCSLHDNFAAIDNHFISSALHIGLKKEKYKYYCEICDTRVMSEAGWRKHNFAGPRHVNMAASRKANVVEYECTTCKTVIFGDELSLTRHLAVGNRGRRAKEQGARLPDKVKDMFRSKEEVLAQAAQLAGNAEEVLQNSLTRDCCEKIKEALLGQFDVCEVYPFGSRVSGIGNKDSDLDVFVDTGNMYYGQQNQDPPEQVIIIRTAVKAFSKNKEYQNIVQVLTARTPILKLHHVPTKLDCDLSFKHGLSVENTKFLRFCIELQPIIQQLIILVKKWAEYVIFENVTTYALATMCIFYLQVNGYLLSVVKLREINNSEPKVINGWKTITYALSLEETKTHVKNYSKTIYELLHDFFDYYAKFDFNSYVLESRKVAKTEEEVYTPTLWYYNLLLFSVGEECDDNSQTNEDNYKTGYFWSREHTVMLIEQLKKYPILYSPEGASNATTGKRMKAYHQITKELMNQTGKPFELFEVKKKIMTLKQQFRRESQKAKTRSNKQNLLWCYDLLTFLKDVWMKKSEDSKDENTINKDVSDDSTDDMFLKDSELQNMEVDNKDTLFVDAQYDDVFDTIGKNVAIKLRDMTDDQRKYAENLINEIMYNGLMENLNADSVITINGN